MRVGFATTGNEPFGKEVKLYSSLDVVFIMIDKKIFSVKMFH